MAHKTGWHGSCKSDFAMKILTSVIGTLIVLATFLYVGSLLELPRIWLIDIGLLIFSFGVMATGSAACSGCPEDARDVLSPNDLGLPDKWK
jgi:hypothetical protein